MLREEKPEAFASPEQNPEDGSSKKKKKRCKWRNKKKKANENPNPQPQVCSEPLVVDVPISELKSNEESVTLPDSNNIPTKKKRKKNRNKKKSMINGEEPKPTLELEKNEEPKPALELEKNKEVELIEVAKTMTRKRKRKSVQNGVQSNEHNIEQAETAVQMSILDREVPPIDKAIAVNNHPVSLDELEERYFERKKTRKERRKEEYLERKNLKSEVKTTGEEKIQNDTPETLAQRPFDPITEPSTDPAVVMDTHPATPMVAELEERFFERKKTRKEKKKEYMERNMERKKLQGEVKTNGEEKTKNDTLETLAQRPFDPITEPSTDPSVVMDTHPATPVVAEQKIAKKKHKKRKRKREAVQYSIAETSVQGTKGVTVTNAPNDQHGQSSMVRNTIHGFSLSCCILFFPFMDLV